MPVPTYIRCSGTISSGSVGNNDDLMQDKKLKWQCRRGMRELDVLLSGWMDEKYDAASGEDKSAFRRLLSLPDPEVARYLLAGERATDTDIARVVECIRGHPRG